jgi:hypothetical protein
MKTNTTEPTGPAFGTCMIHPDICSTGAPEIMTGREINQERPEAVVPTDEHTTGSLCGERKAAELHGGAG